MSIKMMFAMLWKVPYGKVIVCLVAVLVVLFLFAVLFRPVCAVAHVDPNLPVVANIIEHLGGLSGLNTVANVLAGIALVVTFSNTCVFFKMVNGANEHYWDMMPEHKAKCKKLNTQFTVALVASCITLVGMFAFNISTLVRDLKQGWFNDGLMLYEIALIITFFLFVYMERCLARCYEIGILGIRSNVMSSREALSKQKREVENFLYSSDIPAFFGAVVILVIGLVIEYCVIGADKNHALEPFRGGFIIGAICLHVMFSQTSIAFIAALNFWRESQQSAPDFPAVADVAPAA